ncbi:MULTISPECIES: ribonuclease H family protein [unclassified Clostridium]|uniref:ribonuclease H1 domain-containing protein n=1 Tax=Clostridium TaxID=1485 RepID=UPI001C8C8EC1|nr:MULTISPECIES: ribonuclease H family protein [unclassified Clostridium]MBX9138388.1 reverse transcriptase-like protein [Clostridium sp. K12(2020)]MBX9145119.1 reverse transcriptase-like protein [Clostridium sp. K13]MDU2290416.1 ribonuclease H family protein [Clostridium celatum]MDU4326338.1 ribonuclease H family protein [Clostridium celatum]
MAKKVYAIKEGFDSNSNKKIENIIVDTWAECLKYVKGVKGAKYKSFEDMESAKSYLNDTNKLLKKGIDQYPEDCLHVYVDGSYNIASKRYAYGVVAVRNNVVEHIESGSPDDTSKSNIRQIAGELEGAVRAVEYALSKGDKKIVLFHDYEGIFHHATGSWERKDESSEAYYDKINSLLRQGIEVIFVKVDSHTGDLYNELVDEKCKEALGITSDKVVEKWLNKNEIFVSNNKIKESILKLAQGKEDKIIISNNEEKSETSIENKSDKIILDINEILNKLTVEKQLNVLNYVKFIYEDK